MSSVNTGGAAAAGEHVFGQASRTSLKEGLSELHDKQLGARPDRLLFFSVLVLALVSFFYYNDHGDVQGMWQWALLVLACVVLFIVGLGLLRRFFYQRLTDALAASGLRERLEYFWADYDPANSAALASGRSGVRADFALALRQVADRLWDVAARDGAEAQRDSFARLGGLERGFAPLVMLLILALNTALMSGGQLNALAFFSSIFIAMPVCLLAPYFRYLAVYEYLHSGWADSAAESVKL
jgi:hypothetical protein